jgi:hypothetical protein
MTDPIKGIPAYDKLLHVIGKVSQAHVVMERDIRNVLQTLLFPSLGIYLTPTFKSVDQMVDGCRLMLRNADISADVIEAGELVLAAAKNADEKRNRVVHDWWLQRIDEDPENITFERHKLSKNFL